MDVRKYALAVAKKNMHYTEVSAYVVLGSCGNVEVCAPFISQCSAIIVIWKEVYGLNIYLAGPPKWTSYPLFEMTTTTPSSEGLVP